MAITRDLGMASKKVKTSSSTLGVMKSCPFNEHPLAPHFYIGKLGFNRVYILLFLL